MRPVGFVRTCRRRTGDSIVDRLSRLLLDLGRSRSAPAERGNVVGQAGFEQGITVWERGSWFLIPHVNVTLMADIRRLRLEQQTPRRAWA